MQKCIKEILKEAHEYMMAEGFENPGLETKLLVEHIFRNSFHTDREVTHQELIHFNEHMEQLKRKIPIQRQIGYTIINGKRINITPDVLLPGPEIEIMIDTFFEYVEDPKKVADLCTGCGVLASIIGERFPEARVYATDISNKALEVARTNTRSSNIEFLQGDLFEPLNKNRIYDMDVLISNPPYCRTEDITLLPRQIRDHTPRIAVDGGEDGFFFHKKIIEGASRYIKHNGLVILENEVGQSVTLREMLSEKGYRIECTRKNGRGEERVIVARMIK